MFARFGLVGESPGPFQAISGKLVHGPENLIFFAYVLLFTRFGVMAAFHADTVSKCENNLAFF